MTITVYDKGQRSTIERKSNYGSGLTTPRGLWVHYKGKKCTVHHNRRTGENYIYA